MNRVIGEVQRQQLRASAFRESGFPFRALCRVCTRRPYSTLLKTMAAPKPRIQLVLDFDGTMTTDDTTAIIGDHCLKKAKELALPGLRPNELPEPMRYYSHQYFQEYKEWKKSSTSSSRERNTIEDEISYLSNSKQVELNSFLRVRNAIYSVQGGMANMAHDECLRNNFMMKAGREAVRSGEVKLRDPEALRSMIAKASEEGNKWGIVSVSWSRRFILGVLAESKILEQDNVEEVAKSIKSNELLAPLDVTEKGGYTTISSALDKRVALKKLLAEWNTEASAGTDHANVTIYVGDSSTDIGCLISATIGVYVCEDSTADPIVQTLNRVGVRCLPLRQLQSSGRGILAEIEKEHEAIVYLIKGLYELDELLSSWT